MSSSCPSVMRSISFTGSTHSLAILCLRSMAINTLRRVEPSRRAFQSNAAAACGSDCGRFRSWVPRSAETILVDSRKSIRRSQDSSPLGRVSLTKSRESRPPSSRGAEMERGIDGTSSRKRYLNQREITSKNQYNVYQGKSALSSNLFLILKSDMLAGGDGSYETPIGRLSS